MPFLIFRRDHLRSTSGIICGSGSFAIQFGDHFRSGDHLRSGIISGMGSFPVCDHLRRCTDLPTPSKIGLRVGRGLFGVRLLIVHFKFQFSKSIKSPTLHIVLTFILSFKKENISFPKCPKILSDV